MLEIKVISRKTIKPSSPTPHHLRKHHLSFLDQLSSLMFVPFIFFYPRQDSHNKLRSNHLKKSLSEALTKFYPLAGRLTDGSLYINCNDDGVPYMEAQVKCRLSEVIADPSPGELNNLFPYKLDEVGDLTMAIQVNFFDCGGMAIAVAISHKVADAFSVIWFINSWAAIARGDGDSIAPPRYECATLFPPRNVPAYSEPSVALVKEKIEIKRIVFNASNIAALQDKYEEDNRRPSRVEALSAFIWSRFMAANPNKVHVGIHAMNLRTRMDPPLSDCYFGNINRLSGMAVASRESEIVKKMREAIEIVNGEYVKELREEGEKHLIFLKELAEKVSNGELVLFGFSSLCRVPVYEADFGWGKPIWVSLATFPNKNFLIFMDTPSGDEIEAWLNLETKDMAKFEAHKHSLSTVIAMSLLAFPGCNKISYDMSCHGEKLS